MNLRTNVAAILVKPDGRVLVAERRDRPGAWQFPQGGVDTGETLEAALARELFEELSLWPEHYTIIDRRGPYNYLFGKGRLKRGFHGQSQHYFLAEFTAQDAVINVQTPHPEFLATRWIEPAAFRLEWLPVFKREVYRAVFQDFFGIRLPPVCGEQAPR